MNGKDYALIAIALVTAALFAWGFLAGKKQN